MNDWKMDPYGFKWVLNSLCTRLSGGRNPGQDWLGSGAQGSKWSDAEVREWFAAERPCGLRSHSQTSS